MTEVGGSGSREKKEGSVVEMMVLRDSLGEEVGIYAFYKLHALNSVQRSL